MPHPAVNELRRRLSIIDIATGQQPLFNEDGTVSVVFNGDPNRITLYGQSAGGMSICALMATRRS